MNAIILAAGRGSRMGDLTIDLPKCRSVLHGKELIQWQMEAIASAGIKDLGIVRGYLAHTFDFKIKYFENLRWQNTNMVASMLTADPWLCKNNCIVSYSDIVYSGRIVSSLKNSEGDIVISYDPNWLELWSQRFKDPLKDAESFKYHGNCLLDIGKKVETIDEIDGQYMGLLKISPVGWRIIKNYLSSLNVEIVDVMDTTTLLRGLIENGEEVNVCPISGLWYEVDTESDLDIYNKMCSPIDIGP